MRFFKKSQREAPKPETVVKVTTLAKVEPTTQVPRRFITVYCPDCGLPFTTTNREECLVALRQNHLDMARRKEQQGKIHE